MVPPALIESRGLMVSVHPPVVGGEDVAAQLRLGKTVVRALGNATFARWRSNVTGDVLDLAAGPQTSYRALLERTPGPAISSWICADRIGERPDVACDATGPLPFRDAVFDVVFVSWFLNVCTDPSAVLREAHRVLRPGGVVMALVPFVFPVTPEPADYWRFTEQGIAEVVARGGFARMDLVPLGDRWCSAAYVLLPFLRPARPLRRWAARLALRLDRFSLARWGRVLPPCPLGYCVRGEA